MERVPPQLSQEAQSRIDFVHSIVPKRKKHPKSRLILGFLLLVIILVALVFMTQPAKTIKVKKPVIKPPKTTSLASVATSGYSSTYFGLNFSYPHTWALQDNHVGTIKLTSPLTNLVSDAQATVKGNISLTITKQGTLPTSLSSGTALAVLNSQILQYANPSATQNGQTYISFVQYASTNIKGGLDGVYVTGNYGFVQDQVINQTDISSVNPLIYVTFNQCANKSCQSFKPLTIAASYWQNAAANQIVTNIIKSFVFN